MTRRSPGKRAEIAARRLAAYGATSSWPGSSLVSGAQEEAMNALKASELGRWERLFTRSSRGWSLPVVVVASVLIDQSSQSPGAYAKAPALGVVPALARPLQSARSGNSQVTV